MEAADFFLSRLSPEARRELVRVGVGCLGVSKLARLLRVSRQSVYRYLEGSLSPRPTVLRRLLEAISECPLEERVRAARILEAEARAVRRGFEDALGLLALSPGDP